MKKLLTIFSGKTEPTPQLDEEPNKIINIGPLLLQISRDHMIEKYQNQYPLYDKFLPFFCNSFNGNIIDIGANIGDTSIAIFSQNDSCHIIGVEPDKDFFDACMANIALNKLNSRFLGIQQFVTSQVGAFKIEKDQSASTGSIQIENNSEIPKNTINFEELMQLIPQTNKLKSFDLLKIDTDGYDWDIINSFVNSNSSNMYKPKYIFFEMQTFLNNDSSKTINRDKMLNNYVEALRKLQEKGYSEFTIFDNFGTYIMTTNSIETIITVNQYISRSQVKNKYSTIFYLDILTYNDEGSKFVNNKITEFYTVGI